MLVVTSLRLAPLATAAALLLSACGTAAASSLSGSGAAAPTAPATSATAGSTPAQLPSATAPTVAAPAPAVATPAVVPVVASLRPPAGRIWGSTPGSAAVRKATIDGGSVTLLWMDPTRLRFHFVPGYSVPGGPATKADVTPSTWVPRMVAGFNGGFKLSDGAGGYWYRGTTVARLRSGLATFAVSSDGRIRVGMWGRDLTMSKSFVVVRQNLRPLVDRGRSMASTSDAPSRWGAADGGISTANRTALGVRADGSIVFEYGHDVTAYTMAQGLLRAGVREAVVLDMNRTWPTGFVYSHRGGRVSGSRINPAVMRPPSTYYARFTKDFVAVLAR
jgi:hypothetical protein